MQSVHWGAILDGGPAEDRGVPPPTAALKAIDWCRDNANPVPRWNEQSGSVVIIFRPAPSFTGEVTAQVTEEVVRLLGRCQTPQPRDDLMQQVPEEIRVSGSLLTAG